MYTTCPECKDPLVLTERGLVHADTMQSTCTRSSRVVKTPDPEVHDDDDDRRFRHLQTATIIAISAIVIALAAMYIT